MHVGDQTLGGIERGIRADDDSVLLRQDLHDVDLFARRERKAAALADSIVDDAAVRADDIAVKVEERAGLRRFSGALDNDLRIITVRHEADVLTVVLAGVDETGFGCDLARVGLMQAAERKFDPRKLLLRQVIQDIALVLRRVDRFFEDIFLPVALDARIVAGRDILAPHDVRTLKKLVELQIAVAVDAGVRRDPVFVGVHKAVDDAGAELILEVEDIKREAQPVCDAAGILGIVERAAGMALGDARVLVVVELHHAANAVIARVRQQLRRDGGIHAAGHGDQYLFSSHWRHPRPAWPRSCAPSARRASSRACPRRAR